eukprot:m.22637 g.22637  ORF g.22637 m.22637 type:complete len:54 (+) comp9343_c1_seq2:105-266(+)
MEMIAHHQDHLDGNGSSKYDIERRFSATAEDDLMDVSATDNQRSTSTLGKLVL